MSCGKGKHFLWEVSVFQSCTVCRVVKHVWPWGFPLRFEFQALVALEKPCEDSGVRHYFWKSSSSNKLKITINAPRFLLGGQQPGPIMPSSHLHNPGVKVYIELFAFFSCMPLMSVSSSGFNQWFMCFLYPEQTQRHWFPPTCTSLFTWFAVLKSPILFPAELGICPVPPAHSQFQTEVGKKPLLWRNSCNAGKKSGRWKRYSKKMSVRWVILSSKITFRHYWERYQHAAL